MKKNIFAFALILALLLSLSSAAFADHLKGSDNWTVTFTTAGKINSKLTFEDVMEEKQYEMWFGSCRFLDIVRWSKQGKVNLDQLFNKSGLHQNATTVYDAFFTKGEAEHRLYTEPCSLKFNDFVVGKNEYFPFPRDYKNANPNLHDVLGWATE